jgi:TPR repeat protein
MEMFINPGDLKQQFLCFERAAAKGHEESIWITSVVKDVAMEWDALKEAFAKTETPLGRYFAGKLSGGRERFDLYKKSAEAGCSWAQLEYGWYFKTGYIVEKNMSVYLEWEEKAANQNNPQAMFHLGYWCQFDVDDDDKAFPYFLAAAELGWKKSMSWLANMLMEGEGCAKDWRQALIWSAKGNASVFQRILDEAKRKSEGKAAEDLDCNASQLCYTMGWALFWSIHGDERWNGLTDTDKTFGNRCLDYYCACIELQQKSLFTFLLCWNQMAGGVKGPGQMIAKMVWEGREDNLVKVFEVMKSKNKKRFF